MQLRKKQNKQNEENESKKTTSMFEQTILKDRNKCSSTARMEQPVAKNAVMLAEPSSSSTSETDNHKCNRGGRRRTRHSNKLKASILECDKSKSNEENVVQFMKKHRLEKKFIEMLSEGPSGWRNMSTRQKTSKDASDEKMDTLNARVRLSLVKVCTKKWNLFHTTL